MTNVIKAGRLFFGIGIIAFGLQQIVIRDFRPQILPGFPTWAHTIVALPILTGALMVVIGFIIAGILKVTEANRKKITFFLGLYFLTLIVVSHIPYLLFVYPHKLSH